MSPDINAAASARRGKLLCLSSGQICSGSELGKVQDNHKSWWSCQDLSEGPGQGRKELKLSCLPESCFLY